MVTRPLRSGAGSQCEVLIGCSIIALPLKMMCKHFFHPRYLESLVKHYQSFQLHALLPLLPSIFFSLACEAYPSQ